MLTEDQVVDITCLWLERQGWTIKSKCHGTKQGDDIFAVSPDGKELAVECKGSSSPNTQKPFHGGYIWKSVSGALFNTVRAIEQAPPNRMYAMAFPNTSVFTDMTSVLKDFYARNGIYMFWVTEKGVEDVWQPTRAFRPGA